MAVVRGPANPAGLGTVIVAIAVGSLTQAAIGWIVLGAGLFLIGVVRYVFEEVE